MSKGRFTLPGETGQEKVVAQLAELWGADAIRDSDGTKLSPELLELGLEVYSTICVVRNSQSWAREHRDKLQQIYLMTDPVTYLGEGPLTISLMDDFFADQFAVDELHDPKKFWQVYDRTTGTVTEDWTYQAGKVTVNKAIPYHAYTVSFLVWQIWEPVSMYNHITNNWTEEHLMPIDPRHPEVREIILADLEKWLKEHPRTDVVRFTTFFYCFDLMYNNLGKERQVNWFGFAATVSPLALEQFEKEYGYALCAEDFVTQGYYNTPFMEPTAKQLDWMDFNMKFVSGFAKECVDLVHKYNKRAIMFLGDHMAGVEPYGKYFPTIGLDGVVGASGDGVTTRMITDIPTPMHELRFYPYFFPDVFYEGGNPLGEFQNVWLKARRTILQSPADRIGFGGYLSLAAKFPDFTQYVAEVCDEFRDIADRLKDNPRKGGVLKVAVLNTWGELRSWETHQVAHSLWNQRCYSYLGAIEALTGFSFDVSFICFDVIRSEGVPADVDVVMNMGDAGTAWSGGSNWKDTAVIEALRKFVANGGGFIGIGEPTACEENGFFFQLYDVLGVQKEIGFTASRNKLPIETSAHFITQDLEGAMDFGEGMNSIYLVPGGADALLEDDGAVALAANSYGKGRAVYISGLPYNLENARTLLRSIYWAASKEAGFEKETSSNYKCEVVRFENGSTAVINNSAEPQITDIYVNGNKNRVSLEGGQIVWL